jgi:hypothetical protein
LTNKPDFAAFQRVQQSTREDDVFAVIAMLGRMTLAEVFKQAEVFGMPKMGPVFPWAMDASFLAQLLMSRGLVGGQWKECSSFQDLSDVALALCDYTPERECGRSVLFHRLPADHPSKVGQYVIDPYPHQDVKLHVRSDLAGLVPAWYIGVHPAPATKAKAK